MAYSDVEVSVELRGDDVKMLTDALHYVPYDREDVKSYLCFLRGQLLDKLGIDSKPYDMTQWSDSEIEEFLNEKSK